MQYDFLTTGGTLQELEGKRLHIFSLPWQTASIPEWRALLKELAERDLPTARRAALLRLVWQEPFLTREGLIARVEGLLERRCFGKNKRATFLRDMRVIKKLLAKQGHRLRYSRKHGTKGYYVEGRTRLDERLQHLIAGAVAEIDPRQIAIYRRLSPAERFYQGISLIKGAEQIAAYRLRQQFPHLTEAEIYQWLRAREKWPLR